MSSNLTGTVWVVQPAIPLKSNLLSPFTVSYARLPALCSRPITSYSIRLAQEKVDWRNEELHPGEVVLVLEDNIPIEAQFLAQLRLDASRFETQQTFLRVMVRDSSWYMSRAYFNRDSLWLKRL